MGGSPGRWPPRRGYLLHYRAISCQPSQCSNGASSTFRVISGAETCAGGGRDRRQYKGGPGCGCFRRGLAGQLGEGLVPMDCPGCLSSVGMSLSLCSCTWSSCVWDSVGRPKQEVLRWTGMWDGKPHKGSRGVKPSSSAAALIFTKTLAQSHT